ncbi:MAG: flippase [Planctomycetota bacterium]|jgi:O-antigen/teichoic acid export membrane protein
MKPPGTAVRRQIRGSSLLLAGRMLGAASNVVGQIIMVRYLAQTEYGAFAYALSIVTFCQALSMLGMKTTLSRFVPIYHERGERQKLYGILTIAVLVTVTVGLTMVALLAWWPSLLTRFTSGDGTQIKLIAVMAYMIPLQGLDILLINLFASFGKPRAIFLRKFVLAPVLKISVILILVLSRSDVIVMAYGYLIGSVIALLFSLWGAAEVLRREGLLEDLRLTVRGVSLPEVFKFSFSILVTEMVPPLMHSANVFIIGFFYGPAEVAIYTVVLPAARLNKIVMDNVRVLYVPLAARFFARGDGRGLNDLYWQTAIWMAMVSFPIFALTFAAAAPLTKLLYGVQYASSAPILMVLAVAYYFNVAIGCNGETLRILGRLRYLLTVDVVTAVINVVGNVLLIRQYGALGAGICTAGTMILHSLLRQLGLRPVNRLRMLDARCLPFYRFVAICVLVMLAVQRLGSQNLYGALVMVAGASLLLFALTRKRLHIGQVFPELTKVPLIKLLVT